MSAGANRIVEVESVSARLATHRWVWAEEEAERIAAHWAARKAERPAIFNGPILMVSSLVVAEDRADATFFRTDYANLLAWLDWGAPDRSVQNGFAMGALAGSDGGFLLGRMGPHTSQAGRVYFPAGTPDPDDVTDGGIVDLAGSIRREIEEETGLTPGDYTMEPRWTVVMHEGLAAFMPRVRLHVPANEARLRIQDHCARDDQPELSGILIARGPTDIDRATMPGYLQAYLAWAFNGSRSEIS